MLLVSYLGKFYALGAECTHSGGQLEEGRLSAGEVVCPSHEGRFDLLTGEPVSGPPTEPLPWYAVTVDGDDVLVEMSDIAA